MPQKRLPRSVAGMTRPPQTKQEVSQALAEVEAAIRRRERKQTLQDEAVELSRSFRKFVRAAWPIIEPSAPFKRNWHIDAICDHLQLISDDRLRRLQIWVPPATGKSRLVSILWPAWEWTRDPGLRYYTGSYHQKLASELTGKSRDLITSAWYQERWGHLFDMVKLAEEYITNNRGGTRLATSPDMKARGTGFHGHRIVIDDAVNAADSGIRNSILAANQWYDGPLASRGLGEYAEVIVMQRLAENDLAAHAMSRRPDGWTILCLPMVYMPEHPHRWQRDPRIEGELLWPTRYRNKKVAWEEYEIAVEKLGKHQAAGQMQQMPSAREGEIIKRANWNFYDPALIDKAMLGDVKGLPKFTRIVIYWDTSFKEKATSDYVAGGVWGSVGSRRYLLRTFHERASLPRTLVLMEEARNWARKRWPKIPCTTVVEKKSNGVEILDTYQREIPGMVPDNPTDDKTERAIACEPDFDSRSVFLPGRMNEAGDDYDASVTPPWAQDVVEECAAFPNGTKDDLVDMTTGPLNWIRKKGSGRARLSSPASATIDVSKRFGRSSSDRGVTVRR